MIILEITKQMEMILYHSEQRNITVNAIIKDETIWITQKAMAELFGVKIPAISKHLKNIFEDGELNEELVVSKMEIATPHGAIPGKTQNSPTNYYSLDAIISVGYRVNSKQATQFRIWATNILNEYMRKGFAMDDERLKQGKTLLGVTGSGKTYTMANVIAKLNKPTLVIAHNKTLAAQLYSEFKEFFPSNSVQYFVS